MSDDPNFLMNNQRDIRIVPYASVESSYALNSMLDSIFFEASSIKTFQDCRSRASFRHRWLGQYLEEDGRHAFLAVDVDGRVCGYVIGALADPAHDPRHADLGYFQVFQHVTRQFPAHLHINIAPACRSSGLGSRLLTTFVDHVRAEAVPGVHIVTGAGLRNVRFYARNGFAIMAETAWKAGRVVIMARRV